MIEAASPLFVDDPDLTRGKRVLVVEDGPTLTHGEMAYGAGWVAARRFGAAEIVDPRPFAVGSIVDTYNKYPTTGNVLPAMGYGEKQMKELEKTIANADVDLVIIGTPIDLTRVIKSINPTRGFVMNCKKSVSQRLHLCWKRNLVKIPRKKGPRCYP